MSKLLELKDLSIQYYTSGEKAVKEFQLQITKGETVGIVGESGSGKSSIALAIMGLLKTKAKVCGTIHYNGNQLNWENEEDWKTLQWNKIAIVFQNALHILNPQMKIKSQIAEPLLKHFGLTHKEVEKKICQLLEEVGLEEKWGNAYPHQLSGGMRQKVLIAMALACEPELLIVDEPTMSLDPEGKMHIVKLLRRVQEKHQCGLLVISHEMRIIKALCSTIHVLYEGNQLEYGETNEVINQPMHPYTKGLTGASWELDPYKEMWGIPHKIREEVPEGCPFYARCFQARDCCKLYTPKSLKIEKEHDVACARGGIATILKGKEISKTFKVGKQEVLALKR
jgi:peptide/nickel transport system ATP-binding protein